MLLHLQNQTKRMVVQDSEELAESALLLGLLGWLPLMACLSTGHEARQMDFQLVMFAHTLMSL